MELDLTIHTYGYYDALYYILNGLAMLRNSEFYTDIVNSLCIITGCYYAVKMSYSNNSMVWRAYVLKVLGMIVLINALLLPKTEMIIKDHVSKIIGKVDNIPIAFALPVGILEEFGHLVTIGFEQVYAPIEALVSTSPIFSYYNYGMLFGARLKKELRQVRIKDPEFVENMRSFIKQCVVLPAMIGYQFTPKQLIDTPDIWKLVSSKAGTLTRLYIRDGKNLRNVTCQDAANLFENYFDGEIKRVVSKNANTEFAKARGGSDYVPSARSSSILSNILEKNISSLYGGGQKAGDILRQQMMINSISDYTASNYAVARSRTSQESGWLLSSDMASLYLPMLLVVIKCIVYASFMFLVPMLIFSGGIAKYTSYLTLVASLQLWPSLNAIINMIMGTYSNLKTGGSLLLSFSSSSTITNHVDTIVTVAAGLQMVIPFLAFAIMQSGVSSLGHLAGSIIGGLQATSGSIGAEIASGNRSIDNVSEGNSQRYMKSGYKLDYNMQYVEGGNSWQQADGSIARNNPDSSVIYTSGQGINTSVGITKFNLEQTAQNHVTQGIHMSESLLKSDQRALSDAKSNTLSKTADFVSNLAQREHSGESHNYDIMGEQGKSLQRAVNNVRTLKEQYGYSWQQATDAALKASMTAATPLKGLTGIGISGSVEGSLTARNVSDQSFMEDSDTSTQNNTHEDYHNIVKAASSEVWGKDNSAEKHYSDAVRNSYEKQKRLEEQVSMRQETVDNWYKTKSRLELESATVNKDMYQEVLDRCVIEFGMDANSVRKLVDKRHPDVMKVWNKIASEELQNLMPEINSGKHQVSGQHAEKALNDFSTEHDKRINRNPESQVKEIATKSDITNNEEFTANIKGKEGKLKNKFEEVTGKNTEQYNNIRQVNELERKDLQAEVDKYEQDRIGQGKTARGAAWFLNKVNAGETIGGPAKGTPKGWQFNKGAYQNVRQGTPKDSK
ncbi:conjugal transfer protein TraG N-terminal domain-containing protein [Candidatus Tisiphia endosymbiont of Ditula angustiorana]|uniref:conjugal transfer protein TraG N-terminal domain-containing protein n=1 Tax=Candidatus Tisiphia endosymbiont of Ditula angustiorana TaxID=3066272 RepID=UPI00312C8D83